MFKREVRTSLSFWRNLTHALKSRMWMTSWDLWSDRVGRVSGWSFRQGSGGGPEKGARLNGEAAWPAGQDHLSCQERRGQRQPSSPRARLPGDPSTRDKQARRGPPSQEFNKEDLPFSSFPGSSITKATSSPTKSTRDPRIILHTAFWKALFPLDMNLWNKPQCQALEVKVQVETHDPVILMEGQAGPGQSHSHPGRRGPPPKRWIFRNSSRWPGDKVSFKLLCVVRV